ncbi:MAG: hypothetical protein WAJ93_04795 [Candidatus Nitrosopolaris sp.]
MLVTKTIDKVVTGKLELEDLMLKTFGFIVRGDIIVFVSYRTTRWLSYPEIINTQQ